MRVNRSCKVFFAILQDPQLVNLLRSQNPVASDLRSDRVPPANLPDSAVAERQDFRSLSRVVEFFWFRFHAEYDTARDNATQAYSRNTTSQRGCFRLACCAYDGPCFQGSGPFVIVGCVALFRATPE